MDKDLYMPMVQTNTEQLQNQLANSELTLNAVISKTCQLMKNAAVASSSAKLSYNAKPKLKVWTTEIKSALKIMRSKYKIWKDKRKPRDTNNPICKEKKESKKEFRRLIRVELAKQRNDEKELIMETKTKNMRLFPKLVRNNRKKENDVIMDLNVNGIQYEGEENIITGFREHFRQLATLDPGMDIDDKYHNMVEEEIKIINEIVADKNIPNINSDEIMKAIRSINRGKSADYHGLTIEHIANAGKDMENLLLVITNEIFRPETLKVGLLTPIFKNKGLKSQATNYRDIRDRPFNLKGEGYDFLLRSEFFFRTTQELEFFFVAQSSNFFSRI